MLPVLWRATADGRLRAVASDRWGVAAVVAGGFTLVASGFLFRLLPGPQAGLVIAIVPALLLLPSRVLTGRSLNRALPFVLVSVLSAAAVPLTGGVGQMSTQNVFVACWFVTSSMAAKLTLEQARLRHGSWILVATGIAVGTVGTALVVVAGSPSVTWSSADLTVAVVIAVLGTLGRVLQTFSLPHLGSVVTSTASQVTAAITAVGGVLLFADVVSTQAVALGLVAAAAAVAATVLASRPAQRAADVAAEVTRPVYSLRRFRHRAARLPTRLGHSPRRRVVSHGCTERARPRSPARRVHGLRQVPRPAPGTDAQASCGEVSAR